jgi:ribosomal protein S18 acetylase RimI-like enzyme
MFGHMIVSHCNLHSMIPDFRCATDEDASAISEIYLLSRKELVACAPLVHADDSVRHWISSKLIPEGNVTVALVDQALVGFVAVSQSREFSWIQHLYVLPTQIRHGIGTALLHLAKSKLVPPIRLYTFQCNEAARSFYEHHGFKAIAYSDGSENEENCPDILYEWRPE